MPNLSRGRQKEKKMAKVSAEIGLTLKLFKDSQFEFIRPSVKISEIDAEKDVKEQLDLAVKALNETWEVVTEQINQKVLAQMPQVNAEMELQVSRKLRQFENAIKEFNKRIISLEKAK